MKSKTVWIGFLLFTLIFTGCTKSASPGAPVTPIPSAASPTSTSPPLPSATPTSAPMPLPADAALKAKFAGDLQSLPDATHYTISIDIDLDRAEVNGSETIHYTNRSGKALDELYLRLFPNTPVFGGKMSVYDLTVDGQTITPIPESDGSALRLPLATPLAAGKSATLSLGYSVAVPMDSTHGYAELALVNGVMALANAYPFIPVHGPQGWDIAVAPPYGDPVFGEAAVFNVHITAPPGLTLAASGTCESRAAGTWDCVGAPMRDFYLLLSDRYASDDRVVDGTTIRNLYYSSESGVGKPVLDYAAQSFAVFSQLFGEYPYRELTVAETPNQASGIEYPGVVVIADRIYGDSGTLEWVVAHEVAHQWWYGVVGNDQINQPWLDEALAQYATYLYFAKQYDIERADQLLNLLFVRPYQQLKSQGHDLPAGLPVGAYESPKLYATFVYDKGPLYFDALSQAVGRDVFIQILQRYYADNRYGIATPQSFLDAVKAVTGDAHLDLYHEWITGPESPAGATPTP